MSGSFDSEQSGAPAAESILLEIAAARDHLIRLLEIQREGA